MWLKKLPIISGHMVWSMWSVVWHSLSQMEATAHFMIADLFLSNTFTVTKEKKIRLTVQPLFECQWVNQFRSLFLISLSLALWIQLHFRFLFIRFENLPNLFECSIKRDLLDTEWEPPQQEYYWNNIAPDLQVQKKMSLTHIVAALDLVSCYYLVLFDIIKGLF